LIIDVFSSITLNSFTGNRQSIVGDVEDWS